MTVYHIVLLKLKPGLASEKIDSFISSAKSMVGVVPGLQSLEMGPPLPSTASRGKGYDMCLVAVLEKPEDVAVYAKHPAHVKVSDLREELTDDTLAYDLTF